MIPTEPPSIVTGADVRAAAARIGSGVHRTPVVTCATLDALAGRRVFLKCENFQRVGAFKIRGATNAVRSLAPATAHRGVATHSSGNHAQALALAAREEGLAAHIVMPEGAPAVKRRATEGYGARIITCGNSQAEREAAAAAVVEETGATLVPPYDHPLIIAGQGTVALELLEQVPGLQAVVAPVGGGGLMSGVCVALAEAAPRVRLIGAEPAGADDAARSLAQGRRLPQDDPATVADGLRTGLGELTWPILQRHLETIVTVSDEAILAAMRLLFERAKLVVEPSGAVSLAAVLDPAFAALPPGIQRVGVVLSGGNVDTARLPF